MKISNILFSAALILFLPLTANAATIIFDSVIDGAQANAGAGSGSPGVGNAAMTFDTDTNLFSWFIGWQGLRDPATLIFFHGPAAPGFDAFPVITASEPAPLLGLTSPQIGSATLSDDQATDLMANLWYINIHTQSLDRGAIRGQVFRAAPSQIPIPATAWLFLSGIAGLLIIQRKANSNAV